MTRENVLDMFLNAGKKLTPLNGKVPILKEWNTADMNEVVVRTHPGNLGWVLGELDFVIDVDPRNGGFEGISKLIDDINENRKASEKIDLRPTVTTPRGGFHIYLKLPSDYLGIRLKKNIKKYKGVDFISFGKKCTIPSSETENGKYTFTDPNFTFSNECVGDVPPLLISTLAKDFSNSALFDIDDMDIDVSGPDRRYCLPKDKIEAALYKISPSIDYEPWLTVGMALHDWDPVEGLDVWDTWSKRGNNYQKGVTKEKWDSFGESSELVTVGSLFYQSRLSEHEKELNVVNNLIDDIKSADEKTLEVSILPKIKKKVFENIALAKLEKTIQDRYKSLTNTKVPISIIRKAMSPKSSVVQKTVGGDDAWCNKWIYVNSHSGFMNTDTLKLYKSEAFNVVNGKHVPPGEHGAKPTATRYVSDNGLVDSVEGTVYLPSNAESTVVDINGVKMINTFNTNTVPKEAEEFTKEGLAGIDVVKNHIKFICGSDENSHILTQWLAHQVQYPGKQILWAPIIQSIQGVGKSFLGELLRSCLGDNNVGSVAPRQVTSDFNGWATDVVVNILEELRVMGHNRYEAVNALKPLITDRMIQINDKRVRHFVTQNTANYMCFTNYKDCIPLEHDDRRWWVLFVEIESVSDLKSHVGYDAGEYFKLLFNVSKNYGGELRKWFLEYPISKKFLNTKQAPTTFAKLSMIATEECSHSGVDEVKQLLEKGDKYFSEKVISSADLFDTLSIFYPKLEFGNRDKNKILKILGYSAVANPIQIDGKSRRLWTKIPMRAGEAKNILMDQKQYNERSDNYTTPIQDSF